MSGRCFARVLMQVPAGTRCERCESQGSAPLAVATIEATLDGKDRRLHVCGDCLDDFVAIPSMEVAYVRLAIDDAREGKPS